MCRAEPGQANVLTPRRQAVPAGPVGRAGRASRAGSSSHSPSLPPQSVRLRQPQRIDGLPLPALLGSASVDNCKTCQQVNMCLCRILFGLMLVVRTLLHLLVAAVAAKDLNTIMKLTDNPVEKIANKVLKMMDGLDINELIKEFTIPLVFYIFLGAYLFILTCIYPWRKMHKSRLTLYAMMHLFFMLAVVYMVYIRGMINVAKISVQLSKIVGEESIPVYEFMAQPELYPVSLVLDVLTFIAAVTSVQKSDGGVVTLPLYRMVSGVSVRVTGGQPPAMPRADWTADSAKLISPPAYTPIQSSPMQSS